MSGGGWKRYAGPAAFLLAATIAVVLVRAGLESGHGGSTTVPTTQSRPGGATTTTAAGKHRRRFYTVRAGDSFGAIAAKTKVPVATIERLNPGVASTTLHIGQRIRIG